MLSDFSEDLEQSVNESIVPVLSSPSRFFPSAREEPCVAECGPMSGNVKVRFVRYLQGGLYEQQKQPGEPSLLLTIKMAQLPTSTHAFLFLFVLTFPGSLSFSSSSNLVSLSFTVLGCYEFPIVPQHRSSGSLSLPEYGSGLHLLQTEPHLRFYVRTASAAERQRESEAVTIAAKDIETSSRWIDS